MQCLQLTRGEPLKTTVDVVLSGDFQNDFGYVTIDGTKYTSAQKLTVAKGTSVTVYCASPVLPQGSFIKLNGTKVAEGTPNAGAEYTFAVTDSCSIVLSMNKQVMAFYADITMPA